MSQVPESSTDPDTTPPQGWQASAAEFVTSRIELIQLEAREAGRHAAKKGVFVAIVVISAFLFWLLFNAGMIGLISAKNQNWPWYGVALVFAALHLITLVIAFLLLRKPGPENFPHTRSELSKDREWLNRLNNPKSPL